MTSWAGTDVLVDFSGLDAAIDTSRALAKAVQDMTKAYKLFGADLVKKTDDGFQSSVGFDGEAWEPLAASTIDARIARVGGFKRTKKGKFTKGALKKQAKMSAAGGIKPLVDTARARNSQHVQVSRDGLEWSAVGYLGTHMAGTDKAGRGRNITIPKRNPTGFELVGGQWVLRDSAKKLMQRRIFQHLGLSEGGT